MATLIKRRATLVKFLDQIYAPRLALLLYLIHIRVNRDFLRPKCLCDELYSAFYLKNSFLREEFYDTLSILFLHPLHIQIVRSRCDQILDDVKDILLRIVRVMRF